MKMVDSIVKMASLLELPTSLPADLAPETILAFTRSDKKGRGGRPQYVLLAQAGKVAPGGNWAREVPDGIVLKVLEDARG